MIRIMGSSRNSENMEIFQSCNDGLPKSVTLEEMICKMAQDPSLLPKPTGKRIKSLHT